MASNKSIKGITVEIGGDTTGLNDALKSVDDKAADLNKELRQVNKLLKLDPGNTVLLAQKQEILSEQIANSKERLQKFNEVQEQVKAQYERGDIDGGTYRKFQKEIEDTTIALRNQEKALEDAKNDTSDLGDEVDSAGDKIKKSGGKMSNFGEKLKNAFTFTAIISEVRNLLSSISSLVESSMELSEDLSKFEQNVRNSGNSMEGMEEHLRNVTALTGETDSSIEALSNLMAIGFDDSQMAEAVDALSGAVIKFPDTLKIESLSDSLQETIATGSGVGQFAELIERSGDDLDEFNERLAAGKTESDRQRIALEWLSDSGLAKVNEEYVAANASMLEYKKASYDSAAASAEVAEQLVPLSTLGEKLKTKLFKALSAEMTKAMPKIQKFVKKATDSIKSFLPQIKKIVNSAKVLIDPIKRLVETTLSTLQPILKNVLTISGDMIDIAMPFIKTFTPLIDGALKVVGMFAEQLTGVIGKVTGFASSLLGLTKTKDSLSETLDELSEGWDDAVESSADSVEAYEKEEAETEYLIERLDDLVDENGRVIKSKDEVVKAVDELKEKGYDVEYDAINNQITGWQELRKEIRKTYNEKRLNARLEAIEPLYEEAMEKSGTAYKSYSETMAELNEAKANGEVFRVLQLEKLAEEYKKQWIEYGDVISTVEKASELQLEDDIEGAVELLDKFNAEYVEPLLAGRELMEQLEAAEGFGGLIDALDSYEGRISASDEYLSELNKSIEEKKSDLKAQLTAIKSLADEYGVDSEYVSLAKDEIKKLSKELREMGVDIPDNLADGVIHGAVSLDNAMEWIATQTVETLSESVETEEARFNHAVNNVIGKVSEKIDTSGAKKLGRQYGSGFVSGLNEKFAAIQSAAAQMVDKVTGTIRKLGKVHSPSRVMREYGQFYAEGLELGMLDRLKDVEAVSSRVVSAMAAPAAVAGSSSVNISNTNYFNTTAARDGTALVRQINRELGSLYYKR